MRNHAEPLSPLWPTTTPPLPAGVSKSVAGVFDALPVDAIVIGAGVTGLSTALHLAERGAKVLVLERDQPGFGSSGFSNGQIIAGLQKSPEDLIAAYGEAQGERLVAFSGQAPELLFELVRRYRIDCDAEQCGWLQATRSTREIKDLEKIADSWARRGAPVRMIDRPETRRLLGTRAYAGAWLDARNGTIHPLAYTRGLANAAARAGVSIHCGINVIDLERAGQVWLVQTEVGVLSAAAVVLATNVYTSQLQGIAKTFLGRAYVSAYSVQLASEPLDAGQLQSLLPERHSCGDTSHLRLRYFRLDRENRFVIGGPGWLTPPRSSSAISFRLLEASARRMFPQLKRSRFEYRWAARDTVTTDLLPHLYEPAPGLFSALGFNGRGLAIGTALGSVLAARVLGEDAAAQPFPTTPASATPLNLPATVRYYFNQVVAKLRGHRR